MNRIKLLIIATLCTTSAFSQISTGDGYYRVRNADDRGRYISVVDNRGSVSVATTSADMGALKTLAGGFNRVVSDPSTIVYFLNKGGKEYDMHTQGTSSYTIVGYTLTVKANSDGTYYAYASSGGMTKYLCDKAKDGVWDTGGDGVVVDNSDATRKWYLDPVTTSNSYFGFTPDVTANGSYYKSFYAEFPFTFASSGMSAHYVSKVDEAKSAVVIKDLTSGVPAATPVIVKCSSTQASANKVNVGASVSGSASGNLLKGVYFCNDVPGASHRNVVNYNAATMRVLGTASDGSLAFVKSSTLTYIPANTAYITVSSNAPDVLKVYTQSEYDALPAGVRGDLNNDGIVSAADLVMMTNMILGKRAQTAAADLNGDGSVSAADYVMLVNLILKQ